MKIKIVILSIIILIIPMFVYAQRGCCSHHGGVAYCDTSTGKQICNDGTYSPSCRCSKIDNEFNERNYYGNSNNDENTLGIIVGLPNNYTEPVKNNPKIDSATFLLITFTISLVIICIYFFK